MSGTSYVRSEFRPVGGGKREVSLTITLDKACPPRKEKKREGRKGTRLSEVGEGDDGQSSEKRKHFSHIRSEPR